MQVVILNHSEVERLLPMYECIEVMENALVRLSKGQVHQPLRSLVSTPKSSGLLGMMPGWDSDGEQSFYGLKEVCVFPDNPSRGLDSHLGAVLLHDGTTGELLVIANASAITAIRTAAVSAVATRALARPGSTVLLIVGTGVQARSHLESLSHVMNLEEVRVVGRNLERAEKFASELADSRFPCHPMASVEDALKGSDVIVTATSSREPVLRGAWLEPGMHLNLVGSSVKGSREVDGPAIAAGRLFVDRRESTENESGDFLSAVAEGAIGLDHIVAELGDVLAGGECGRESEEEITIFKSLGLAIEDLASAEHLLMKARASGKGTLVDF